MLMRTVARPQSLANLLGRPFALALAALRAISPGLRRSKVTGLPGFQAKIVTDLFLGTVTWPWLVRMDIDELSGVLVNLAPRLFSREEGFIGTTGENTGGSRKTLNR